MFKGIVAPERYDYETKKKVEDYVREKLGLETPTKEKRDLDVFKIIRKHIEW